MILWGYAIVSLLARPDLGIGAKLLWLVGILLVPIIGSILYFMLQAGAADAEPARAGAPQALRAAQVRAGTSRPTGAVWPRS